MPQTGIAEEAEITLDELKQMLAVSIPKKTGFNPSPWRFFTDFDKTLATLTEKERKIYESAQAPNDKAGAQSLDIIKEMDLLSFKRAYPHLAPIFDDPEIKANFHQKYHKLHSYGMKRWLSWRSREMADRSAERLQQRVGTIKLDAKRDYLKQQVAQTAHAFKMRRLTFESMVKLAVCDGYGPSVRDVMVAIRVHEELELAGQLSYLLMRRVRANNMRPIFEKVWVAEIDKDLDEDQKQKLDALLGDKEKLFASLRICKEA